MNGICSTCGETFKKRKSKTKYCSPECAHKAQIKDRPSAVCGVCGRTFTVGRDRKGMYCSRECQHNSMKLVANAPMRERLANDYKRQYNDMMKWMDCVANGIDYEDRHQARSCIVCGESFVPRNINYLCCGEGCSRRYDNRCRDKRIYRNGKPDLSISLTKLYLRDGGVCRLCGKEIDFDGDSNSNDYPSIDHIIPIAHGGLHEWSNVQLACRGCNARKCDSMPEGK